MKKLIIIFFFILTPLYAEKIERLGFYNLQEILEDDNLTYKIIKGCVSLNSAVTEIIKEQVQKYIPAITIDRVFVESEEKPATEVN